MSDPISSSASTPASTPVPAPATAPRAGADQGRSPRPVREVEVVRTERLSPALVRVVFTGAGLDSLPELSFTDHYIKIIFPPAGADYAWPFDPEAVKEGRPAEQWPVTRTYTIRSFDRERRELVVDFVVHGDDGLAGPWAAGAQPGDRLGFRGPGGAYAPEPGYDHHLLVGDEAALPAVFAALERVPATASATVLLEVEDGEHELAVPSSPAASVRVEWVHRGNRPYGEALAARVREVGRSEGRVQAFVHGNAEMIKDARRHLFGTLGLTREQVSISGYWRTGHTEDRWQATKRDFNAAMEAEDLRRAGR